MRSKIQVEKIQKLGGNVLVSLSLQRTFYSHKVQLIFTKSEFSNSSIFLIHRNHKLAGYAFSHIQGDISSMREVIEKYYYQEKQKMKAKLEAETKRIF